MRHNIIFNKDSEDLSNYVGQVPKYSYIGYCTSYACAGDKLGGVIKFDYDGPANCPKCSYAIGYRKKRRVGHPGSEF